MWPLRWQRVAELKLKVKTVERMDDEQIAEAEATMKAYRSRYGVAGRY